MKKKDIVNRLLEEKAISPEEANVLMGETSVPFHTISKTTNQDINYIYHEA